MKLRSNNGEIEPAELRAEIYAMRGAKSGKSELKSLEKKFDKKQLKCALKKALNKREVFMYEGEFIPFGELLDYYDEISQKILALVSDLEKTMPEGVDPVHIFDSESQDTLEYYPLHDKLNISWDALNVICREMDRRGDIFASD